MARESTIGSTFYLQTNPGAAGVAATAATAGAKTTITVSGTYKVGDFVIISGSGSKKLDRMTPHRISAVGTGDITLDTDTTGETLTATLKVLEVHTVEVCFAEFGNEPGTPGEVDVTTMCDLERRNVAGLSSPGSATFSGPLDLSNAGQQELIKAQQDGKDRALIWVTRGGQTGMMTGTLSSFSAAPPGVEQAVTFNGTFQIKEAPVYLDAIAVTP